MYKLLSYRSAVADGLIGVGEALEAHGTGPVDVILGLLSQGIGFWWGDLADIEQAISLFRDALLLTEQEAQVSTPCIVSRRLK